jgi:hypothetical protein
MFASAQLLRNWREKRPSKKSDLDSNVTGWTPMGFHFCAVVCDCCWAVLIGAACTADLSSVAEFVKRYLARFVYLFVVSN